MNDLDQIKQSVMIVDICSKAGIDLIKRGGNYVGLCPFHNEKTPSFTIHPKENFYKCFGCGAGGDVIEFYKDVYRLEYAEAIKELKGLAGITDCHPEPFGSAQGRLGEGSEILRRKAPQNDSGVGDINKIKECMSADELYIFDERSGIELELEENSEKNSDFSNKTAIRAVQQYRMERNKEIFFELFTYCLKHFNNDEAFRKYLIEERKLSPQRIELADLFYIGNYNQVNNHLKKKFRVEDLQRAGLFNDNGNMIFFQHKIIIPYKWKNEIVYLRGRTLPDCHPEPFGVAQGRLGEGSETLRSAQSDKQAWSKYLGLKNDGLNLNTPKRFYGADVIEGLFPGEHLYITEGEFDALVMMDLGYNAVAIPGVGNIPNANWLKRLFPFKVTLLPDQDEAGKQLEDKLKKFFNDHHKTIYSKHLNAKDVSELVAQ